MDGPSLAVGIKRARPDLNTQNRSWGCWRYSLVSIRVIVLGVKAPRRPWSRDLYGGPPRTVCRLYSALSCSLLLPVRTLWHLQNQIENKLRLLSSIQRRNYLPRPSWVHLHSTTNRAGRGKRHGGRMLTLKTLRRN